MSPISESTEQTKQIGESLSSGLTAGSVVCLYGELGAGKTTFIKGLAKGLGIEGPVISPTYVLLRQYGNSTDLYHIDLFRIESIDEFFEAGLDEYLLTEEGIVAIEWAGRVKDILPRDRVDVRMNIKENRRREITITRHS